jgi:prepilin-type processing-associated H-X9-DG protein
MDGFEKPPDNALTPKKTRWPLVIVGLVACLALVVVLTPVNLWPVDFNRLEQAQSNACLGNAKRLALSWLMYSADNGNRLPPKGDWQAATLAYSKTDAVYHCPVAAKNELEIYGYAGFIPVAGLNPDKIDDIAFQPMIFDSSLLGKSEWSGLESLPSPARHRGRNTVAFADGHAKRVATGWKGDAELMEAFGKGGH